MRVVVDILSPYHPPLKELQALQAGGLVLGEPLHLVYVLMLEQVAAIGSWDVWGRHLARLPQQQK